MLSYQHGFHAGNHADVLKHAVLSLALARLTEKDRPITYIDSHSGAGCYDLEGERALKTGEASSGVLRLLGRNDAPGGLAPYLSLCERLYADGRRYPGSPAVAAALTRAEDRLVLMELHPGEHERLKAAMSADARAHVHFRDGFTGLTALCPPVPRRGLALVDPSYETDGDYPAAAEAVRTLARKWPEGIVAVWYPLVPRRAAATERLKSEVAEAGKGGVLCVEFCPSRADESEWGLFGSGMLVTNPPWRLDEDIGACLPWISGALAADASASSRLEWLSPRQ